MVEHVPLPSNATLRDVIATLDDPVDFVSLAYGVINRFQRGRGSAVVLRLGVSPGSKGKRPNYRIDDAETDDLVAVIDGNNHQCWPGDDINLSGDWSKSGMTHAEVKELLAEIRALQPAKRATRSP